MVRYALWFDKAPSTQSFVTGTAKIIHADVAATGAVELQKEGAVKAVRQHASAFTELAIFFRQTAFVAFAWENRHVSLISFKETPRLCR
jgi:hypothetical protein